ncbi:MAG: IS110 family transposase [Acidimicrobiales bacterium]
MQIVGGLDVHRAQITFDCVDLRTGEELRGQIKPATREEVRAFLAGFGGKSAAFALEATTGWRFIVEELRRAGMETHLAEPADTRAARGRKRRAKTDRADARLLRDLLLAGEIPESWIPPDHLADLRTTVRLRKALISERTAWRQRMHAQLFHHGLAVPPELRTSAGREFLERAILPPAARQVLTIGMSITDRIDSEIDTIDRQLVPLARRLPGCQVLTRQWGVGPVLAATILAELGDTRRFSSSRQAVRFAGLDVSVEDSDGKRPPGHLTRQGPPALRWALYEAATSAWRVASPDHDYYLAAKERIGTKRARISVARRILRRIHHELAECGDEAFAEAA